MYSKKILKIVFSLVIVFCILFLGNYKVNAQYTIADSGFDSSYDSGGSSSSWSSSSSSSSSWSSSSSDYGSRSSSSSSGSSDPVSVFIMFAFIIGMILWSIFSNNRGYKPPQRPLHDDSMNEAEVERKIKQYIPDFDKAKFLRDGFNTYLAVQSAWMNFKLEEVRSQLTDELFNMYQSQLDTLEVKGEQNIMKDFKLNRSYLKGVNVQNDNIAINAGFVVEFYDYIIEQSSGKVLRGSDKQKIRITYDMKFRKTLNKDKVALKCPNCGADMKHINGYGVCEYCRTKIVTENQEWVLTDKKSINQIRL
ncbi:MAG: TIM44-like domain-containing protein [Clostridia bacterium]|nr:TIM44-like domain-containing protein [Clostridia bacterium]